MKRTFRPRLEQLEEQATPSGIAPPPEPVAVDLGSTVQTSENTTAATVQAAIAAQTYGVALAFLIADHWDNGTDGGTGGAIG